MSSTFSSRLRIELIGAGEQAGAWNNTTNNNLGTLIEEAVSGVANITLTGTTYTLSTANGATDEARQMVLSFDGNPGGNATVTAPAVEKVYIVKNGLSGGYTLTIQTSAGGSPATVTIPNGSIGVVYTDGTDFENAVKEIAAGATIGGDAIATVAGAETLTNKTLTSPTINTPTITGGSISSLTTDLAVADGGTGASDAATARTNLGIGTTDSPQFLAVNLGDASDTTLTRSDAGIIAVEGVVIPTVSSTSTITNKRNQKRVNSSSNPSSISPSIASYDMEIVTALAQTLTINAPSGTPVQGESIIFRIKDGGTSQTLSWNSIYRSMGSTLPTATTAGKTTYVGAIYNSTDVKWDVVAVATEA